ncbi:MAG: CHASE3 domain-containing protein [Capsulimonadales bacterium]|nr:CHASE3 domain-containing protein [Capsulimonadales bacterium]
MDTKLTIGFLTVMLVIGANAFIAGTNLDTVARNRQWVTHTQEVLWTIETVLSLLKDAETGQRGFLLTGRPEYLLPYEQARQALPPKLGQLRELTADNPEQQRRLREIERLTTERLAALRTALDLRRTRGDAAARQWLLSGRGRTIMVRIRGEVEEMEKAERLLLLRREWESEVSERRARLTLLVASLVSLTLLLAVYLILARTATERRRAADALKRREEWLSATLAAIGDAVLTTDEKGNVLFLNGVAETLTGWLQHEAQGKKASEVFHIVHETTGAPVQSPVDRAIAEGVTVGLANHTVLIARDGTRRPIEDSGAPIRDIRGNLAGVVLVFRDVSERRRAEIERERQVAEVEQLNARLRRAMTETHHRVKNNLQIMSALLDLRQTSGQETVPMSELAEVSRHLQALGVIHDILTQESKTESGLRRISVKSVLERLMPLLESIPDGRPVRAEIAEVLLPSKQATSVALITNELVSNGIKHGRGTVELSLRAEGDTATLTVCDDGPGFPPDFDPETAAHTGIELLTSIVGYDLGGTISFENAGGGGAKVVVTFPVPEESGPRPDSGEPLSSSRFIA